MTDEWPTELNHDQELAEIRMELYDMVVNSEPPFDWAPEDLIWLLETVPNELIEKCSTALGYTGIVMGYVGFQLIAGVKRDDKTRH